ncbi:MAG: DNA methyltransferase [Proteobacteria bacterium]|nr:DNA methyltransferase [Pseudomonadota bacterium]
MKKEIIKALNLKVNISGHTHAFYNYPARFHPQFARTIIEYYTEAGDCIIDPFMGCGTTAVEALVCGRRFLGVDVNPLATFVASVKTTPLTTNDLESMTAWLDRIQSLTNLHDEVNIDACWNQYTKNVPWWIRKTIMLLLQLIETLESERQKKFARCAVLSTGQWALDCKTYIPNSKSFIKTFQNKLTVMLNDMHEYQKNLRLNLDVPLSQIERRRKMLCRSIVGIQNDMRVVRNWKPAKLVLTSPPYPGVHIVYNRWQIKGRKETPAPYWIINTPDGNGLSYYTLGHRKQKGLMNYFQNLKASFESIKTLLNENSIIVQLVGFSNPSWQLERYLEVMNEIGYQEINCFTGLNDRYSRSVPNRKWYTQYRNSDNFSEKEFLLIHKLI